MLKDVKYGYEGTEEEEEVGVDGESKYSLPRHTVAGDRSFIVNSSDGTLDLKRGPQDRSNLA